jgi:hypothetical protein
MMKIRILRFETTLIFVVAAPLGFLAQPAWQ